MQVFFCTQHSAEQEKLAPRRRYEGGDNRRRMCAKFQKNLPSKGLIRSRSFLFICLFTLIGAGRGGIKSHLTLPGWKADATIAILAVLLQKKRKRKRDVS